MRNKRNSIPVEYSGNNKVKLVKGGREYFDLLEKMIQDARNFIHLQIYIFDEDATGTRIAKALIHAAQRKVTVYVLVDGYASQNLSEEFIQDLHKAGIHFRYFEPLWRSKNFYFGRRLHHKIVVVDSVSGMVGGMNISDRYNDMPECPAWLDWALYVEGEVAVVLDNICRKWMNLPSVKYETGKQQESMITKTQFHNVAVRVRINDWVARKKQITYSYIQMLRSASSHIIMMSPYFLPGNKFRRQIRLAARRGIKIKIILTYISDIWLAKQAERFLYRWLLNNNIEIYEYHKNVLHGKIAVCDDQWVTVGSYNVNNLSAYASVELNLEIDNDKLAEHVDQRLERIIENDCIRVTKDGYERTNFFKSILQRLIYYFFHFVLFMGTFYYKSRE